MKTIVKPLFVVFSASFLIFGFIFQIINGKISQGYSPNKVVPQPSVAEGENISSPELSCLQNKDGGKVELSLLQQQKEENKSDCLLMGCNIYEFD